MMYDESVVTLGPERVLTVTRYGPQDGAPVLYFHGAGDCSLAVPTDTGALDVAGVTLYAIDRPGYGRSTRMPGRTLLDWADDVNRVADLLGLDTFCILAWSAGSVHAFACAERLPRVSACAVYGAVAPPSMPDYAAGVAEMSLRCAAAARDHPDELRTVMAALTADPVGFTVGVAAAEHDGGSLDPEVTELLTTIAQRAFAQGSDPMVDDFELIYRDWDLTLADVRCPVLLAVGTRDIYTPPSWTRWIAGQLPSAQVMEIANAVHGDFLRPDVFERLVTWLAQHSSDRPSGGAVTPEGG